MNSTDLAPYPFDRGWSLPDAISFACLMEASAPKAGNVHPQASFSDMNFTHFAGGAIVIAKCFQEAGSKSIGALILDSVNTTKQNVGCNINLGTLLLFGPIAKAWDGSKRLQKGLPFVLERLTSLDSQQVYQAIRTAQPGGLGQESEHDIQDSPPLDLLEAMTRVKNFDAVARQYTNNFHDIFHHLLPWLNVELGRACNVLDAVCRLQLRWLSHEPDGLIFRKLGMPAAVDVQTKATRVWQSLQAATEPVYSLPEYLELDTSLRESQDRSSWNPRNPGTTADLIAATLLVRLLEPPKA